MAVIETYEEREEISCVLCPEPITRLEEVVVMATDRLVHIDCFDTVPLEELADLVRRSRASADLTLCQGAA